MSPTYIQFEKWRQKKIYVDSGRAISFKPDDETTFLVGTDEGVVYLCTTQYSSRLFIFQFSENNAFIVLKSKSFGMIHLILFWASFVR